MKLIKLLITTAIAASLSGCIIPPPDSSYANNAGSGHHHKHHQHSDNQPAGDYTNADGVRMITRDGVTLPDCEAVGGSQADNGSTCFWR